MSNIKADLSERVATLEQEKRTSEEEFGRQRKKFMHHMMESDEKIKQLQQALSRAQDEIRHLKTTSQQNLEEKDTAIARKSAEEIHLKEQFESSKKKYEEEVASLRQGLKVTIEECETEKLHLERELLKFKTAGRARSPSLETSMLQAEAETKVLKAVVVPLEQEIESLKAQLKEAHERAAGPTSSVTPTSNELIDLNVSPGNDDITDVERKLKAERSARQDMEMHVTTLNSQRIYLQQELEAANKQLKAAQLELEKEKTAYSDLKQTWLNANNHFIELQAQYDQQLAAMKQKLQNNTATSSLPASLPTTTQPQINITEVADGAQQSVVEVLSPSSSPGHKRSLSDGISSLPVPESSMEAKKTASLQDVNQDTPCNDSTAACDEVEHYKEMCANYEQQLQRTQRQMTQEMAEKEEAMESIMDTLEKHKTAVIMERKKREQLRKSLAKYQEEMKQQVESYQESEKELRQTLSSLQENFTQAKREAQQQVARMSEERIILTQQTETAREEYECLKAVQSEEMHAQLKKISTAELAQKEAETNVATTFEQLGSLQQKLQETENRLSSEIMFLKEQLQSEQNSKDSLESALSAQLTAANQEIAQLQTLRRELEREKAEATAASQSIKEKCKQFVEAQAKEVDAVKRDNQTKDSQIIELKKVIDDLKANKVTNQQVDS